MIPRSASFLEKLPVEMAESLVEGAYAGPLLLLLPLFPQCNIFRMSNTGLTLLPLSGLRRSAYQAEGIERAAARDCLAEHSE